jgi:hypothetical protein
MNHTALLVAVFALAPVAVARPTLASPGRPPPPDAAGLHDHDDNHDDDHDDNHDHDDGDDGRHRGDERDGERERGYGGRGHDGFERGCPVDVDDGFADLDAVLRALAADATRVHGRAGRAVRGDVDDAFAALAAARERACRAAVRPGPPIVIAPPPAPPPVVVIDHGDEVRLERALHAEAFDEGRVRVLATALRGGVCVTSEQTRAFLGAWAFSSGRADALRVLAPHIVDDGEAYTIFSALPFDSDKHAAHEILEHTPVLPSCRGYR